MLAQLRSRLTYANVMATLGVFVALGGTAYAVNTVGSTDIIDGQVKSVDVGDNEIGSADVKDNSLNTFDVHSFLGVDVVDNTLTGADVDETTLGTVPAAVQGGLGRNGLAGGNTGPGNCDPEANTFINCGIIATLTLPRPGRVLVIGSGRASPDLGDSIGNGSCQLGSTSGAIPGSFANVYVEDVAGGFVASEHMSIAGVTGVLPAGQHSFGIDCKEVQSIFFDEARVTAVALSDQ